MAEHIDRCIFCKIVAGTIPCDKVFEDDDILAFHDIRPATAVHFLIIPKRHVDNLYDVRAVDEPVLGRILGLSARLARDQGLDDGFRIVINNGRIGLQEVYHLHVHVMGGPEPLRTRTRSA